MSDLTDWHHCTTETSMRVRKWNIQFWHLQRIYCLFQRNVFIVVETFVKTLSLKLIVLNINKNIAYDFMKMEQQNIKFDKFKFDATPYIIAANSFSKQFKEQENRISDYAFRKLDTSISKNLSECSDINGHLKKMRIAIMNTQRELDILKREEEQQSHSCFDLKEGCITLWILFHWKKVLTF